MLFAFLNASAARLRLAGRRRAKSRRPELESMEGRQLLAAAPYVMINNPIVTEGTGTTADVGFTVSLSAASDAPVVMSYQTIDRTAVAGSDYIAVSGTLTFAPGETRKTVSVPLVGDSAVELTEQFGLALSGLQNGVFANSAGYATVKDNDAAVAPQLSVADVQMRRGLDGSRTMVFNVTLNTTVATPVTVKASTSSLSAVVGRDYDATTQWLTFNPGETVKQVSVTIYGTSIVTSDKFFTLNLTDTTVGLARKTALGVLKYGA